MFAFFHTNIHDGSCNTSLYLELFCNDLVKDNLHVQLASSYTMPRFQLYYTMPTHAEIPETHAELHSEFEGRFSSVVTT